MLKEFWNTLSGNRRLAVRASRPDMLVVLLGNPGDQYARSRHNLGFMVGAHLLERVRAGEPTPKYRGRYWAGAIDGQNLGLLFPDTFMNDSGRSVRKALGDLGLEPDRLLVVHDDIDLAFGRLRLRGGGTSGGNLGVRSVVDAVGTDEFRRIKLGVGRPPGGVDPADFVLSEFKPHEIPAVRRMVELAAGAVTDLGRDPLDLVMSRYNGEAWASCD